jgi:DNA replication protein DnaC
MPPGQPIEITGVRPKQTSPLTPFPWRRLAKAQVLILDDFGLEPLGASERKELLEVLEDRYGSGATVVTSQLDPKDWHAVIGEPTLADAILDRLVHNAHRLKLTGDSVRDPERNLTRSKKGAK